MKDSELQKRLVPLIEQEIDILVEMARFRTVGCEEEKAIRSSITNKLTAVSCVADNISKPRIDSCGN